jgi:hypothetical protein
MRSRDVLDYRGVQYFLVQTIAPRSWRWHFEFLSSEYSGSCPTRAAAVLEARRAIDNLLRLRPNVQE